MIAKTQTALLLLLALLTIPIAGGQQEPSGNQIRPDTRNIVFVCEHGAALSVVSAAYFNKAAREQHLNWHAIARGVTPQENLSVSAAAGLKKDGVPSEVKRPQAVTQDDLDRADYVVTYLRLPQGLMVRAPIENWGDVKWEPSAYDKTRDAILKHLQQLLETLKAQPKTP